MIDLEKSSLANFEPTVPLVHGLENSHGARFGRFLAHLFKQVGLIFLELDDKLPPRLVDLPGGGWIEMQRIQGVLALVQTG